MVNFRKYIDEHYEQFNDNDNLTLDERMYFDFKVRNGKRVKKWHTDRENYRIQINKKTGQPKEVFITPTERLKRKIGQRKAAIKRRAKLKNTLSKKSKSFRVKRNIGNKYNTNNNNNNNKYSKSNTYLDAKNIYPNMLESRLLCETPWVEVLPDIIWDFYSELRDKDWLLQLVSLCRDHEIVSLDLTDDSNNREYENHIKVNDRQFHEIINRLCNDKMFINIARYAYHNDMEEKETILFDNVLEKHASYLLELIKN